jgi:putative oxidoreductase
VVDPAALLKRARTFNFSTFHPGTIKPVRGASTPVVFPLCESAMIASQRDERARDVGLLFLRVSAGLFLLWVHGLPKLLNYSIELQRIEDPFHLGANLTLMLAIFAEVLCPLLIVIGVLVRLACLPILVVLLVALLIVHPQWSVAEGQFGWLLLILFASIFIAGPGRLAINNRFAGAFRYA